MVKLCKRCARMLCTVKTARLNKALIRSNHRNEILEVEVENLKRTLQQTIDKLKTEFKTVEIVMASPEPRSTFRG